jgi:hypothetical protein
LELSRDAEGFGQDSFCPTGVGGGDNQDAKAESLPLDAHSIGVIDMQAAADGTWQFGRCSSSRDLLDEPFVVLPIGDRIKLNVIGCEASPDSAMSAVGGRVDANLPVVLAKPAEELHGSGAQLLVPARARCHESREPASASLLDGLLSEREDQCVVKVERDQHRSSGARSWHTGQMTIPRTMLNAAMSYGPLVHEHLVREQSIARALGS